MPISAQSSRYWRRLGAGLLVFLAIGASGIVAQASARNEASNQPTLLFNARLEAALQDLKRQPARAAQEIGIAFLRAGHYQAAERWMRRALNSQGALLAGEPIAPLTAAETDHIGQAISARDPSAIFAAGAFMHWRGDQLGAETLTLYELVIGGDRDVQIALNKPFRRALMRADAFANAGKFEAARAELGLDLGAEREEIGALGRHAAYLLSSGDAANADLALTLVLTRLPRGQTLHGVLPPAASPWWRRGLLATLPIDKEYPLAQIVHSALIGKIQVAYTLVEGLLKRADLPPGLGALTLAQINGINSFIASCIPLKAISNAEAEAAKPIPNEEDWGKQLIAGNFAESADLLAKAYQASDNDALLGPYALAALAAAAEKDQRAEIAPLANALRKWGESESRETPESLRAMLTPETREMIISWLANSEVQTQNAMLLRFFIGDPQLSVTSQIELAEREALVERFLPKAVREAYEESLPNPSKAPVWLVKGDTLFRAGKYAEAHAAYLEASRHDPTLAGLTPAMFRADVAGKAFDRASAHLLQIIQAEKFGDATSAGQFSAGLRGFATAATIRAWGKEAEEYAQARSAEWNRVLLVAMLAWEAQDWPAAKVHLETYWNMAPVDAKLAGVEFLLAAASENVKR